MLVVVDWGEPVAVEGLQPRQVEVLQDLEAGALDPLAERPAGTPSLELEEIARLAQTRAEYKKRTLPGYTCRVRSADVWVPWSRRWEAGRRTWARAPSTGRTGGRGCSRTG